MSSNLLLLACVAMVFIGIWANDPLATGIFFGIAFIFWALSTYLTHCDKDW